MQKGTQDNYSQLMSENVYDIEGRKKKAAKIIRVLERFLSKDISTCTVLDFGSSTGIIATEISRKAKVVYGVDVDEEGVEHAKKYSEGRDNVTFLKLDLLDKEERCKFEKKQFDVIVCNQIYEHVSDPVEMLKAFDELLADDGVIYFGATNRFVVMEPHYHLPFLSWFPKSFADRYIRLFTEHERYYEDLLSYPALKKLVNERFEICDVTLDVIKHPARYGADDILILNVLKYVPAFILRLFVVISPNWIWILRKK